MDWRTMERRIWISTPGMNREKALVEWRVLGVCMTNFERAKNCTGNGKPRVVGRAFFAEIVPTYD